MREILTSLKRTPYQTAAAFLVLFFTLLLAGILFVSLSFLQGLLKYVETRPQVIVYFQSKTPESEILAVRDNAMNTGKVSNVKYVSKQEAYKIYKDLTKDNPLLLEMTSADVLPASLEIFAKQPEYLPQIAEFLKTQPRVDEVQFQKTVVDRLLNLTNVVRKATMVLFSYLIIMSIIVLITTTSFKIALKKDEIELLQLIGATKWYIKKPFVKENVFLGFVAATLSTGLLAGILFLSQNALGSYLQGIPALHLDLGYSLGSIPLWPLNPIFLLTTYGIISAFGIAIGFIASYFGTDRYLTS